MERPRPPILRDSLLIVLAYMAARHFINEALPDRTLAEWSYRDAVKCLPRFAAFAALWACNRYQWENAVPFGWERPRKIELPLCAGLLLVGAEAIHLFAFGGAQPFPLPLAQIGLAATLPVVLFEEYAFRGGILHGLRSRLGPGASLLVGSLLFAVFHVEAQPVEWWPSIFLIGVGLAGLRLRGTGLAWLALIHFAIDALYFGCITPPSPLSQAGLVYHALLLLAALLAWPRASDDKIAAS